MISTTRKLEQQISCFYWIRISFYLKFVLFLKANHFFYKFINWLVMIKKSLKDDQGVESTSQDFNYDKSLTIKIVRIMEFVTMINISAKCFREIC